MKRTGIILLGVFVLIAAVSGLVFLRTKPQTDSVVVQQQEDQKSPQQEVLKEEQINQLPQAVCDATSEVVDIPKDWKIYSSESPRFSFKYPGSWSEEVERKPNGEVIASLYDANKSCYIEGSPALCGVHVSIFPITGDESVNVRYLGLMKEVNRKGQAEIKNICVAGKEAVEINDYLRHEIIFDRDGYSFMITAENFGSEEGVKFYWDVIDKIGLTLYFE